MGAVGVLIVLVRLTFDWAEAAQGAGLARFPQRADYGRLCRSRGVLKHA